MNFYPFENVLTISKKELEKVAVKRQKTEFLIEDKKIDGLSNIRYCMGLNYNDYEDDLNDPDSDLFTVRLSFSFLYDKRLCGKFCFYVKSAQYFFRNDGDELSCDAGAESTWFWWKSVFSLNGVLNPENKFIQDDKLTLNIKGMFYIDYSYEYEGPQQTLGHFLWKCDDRDFVISVGKNTGPKTEIKIHKIILGSRSPVFNAMIKSDMREKSESRVEIVDFVVEVVQAAVEFFYDRKTYRSLDLDKLISLLQFAEKYDIKDFKTKIENLLFTHLCPKTVCQIANASITSNSSVLKDFCVQTMIIYINQKVPFDNVSILDNDFTAALLQKASSNDNS